MLTCSVIRCIMLVSSIRVQIGDAHEKIGVKSEIDLEDKCVEGREEKQECTTNLNPSLKYCDKRTLK